jgi:hypothetical protein
MLQLEDEVLLTPTGWGVRGNRTFETFFCESPNVKAMDPSGGHLSNRVARALLPGLSYFKAFADAQSRPWSAEDPGGVINIVVAENKLGAPLVHVSNQAMDGNTVSQPHC